MGNGFSEEANAPEKAMVRPVYDITTMRLGTWKEDKQKRQKAFQDELAALRAERNTAPTLARRRIAALKIQQRILNTAQRRNESRRAAAKYIRYGIKSMVRSNTQKFASNAVRDSPLDRLESYLELGKENGYYTNRKKLFAALTILNNLPNGCDTQIRGKMNGRNSYYLICNDIILNDDHAELTNEIASIDKPTFMKKFRNLEYLYDRCKEIHQSQASFGSQALSTAETATKGAAAIVTNPAEPIVETFWGWFTGFFTRKNRAKSATSESQPQQPSQSTPFLSQPLPSQSTPSTPSPKTRRLVDDKNVHRALAASNLLSRLTSDADKRHFLKIYDEAKALEPYDEREVAFNGFNIELKNFLDSKSRAASRYVPLPTPNTASRIAASTAAEVEEYQDSGAGVFPPPRKGGSRTRKHKRKPRHSK